MTEANVTVSDNAAHEAANGKKEKGLQKRRRGYVVSDKMDKTIVVEVEDRKSHALYGKIVRSTKRVKAHDEDNTAGVGDLVRIEETRPLSKDKHFRLIEIIEKAR
ncbi:30S ribosomal protein S17 [Corynebacterium sanguinis]|uniref:Small ribosomal subunit protein uS17 n=1 Tax=Corynebacterium sanguinis TaxID=2594913 RepID=A0A6C1TVC3_9CORY|nr:MULTISPECIES: 30S ribosomal protein S17 [Corynebacterium]MBA4505114.1 30S ribosomal protein S17 [Corynebacterium sanguinis]MCT1412087.1 30S ribosomal protein S17 [Corynebacterium sanguinis]MCT1413432.1 30S ribosomal protein S17 [Corynebacterium sanguinis]MCT1425236.1 30S ribosomal protein S17 [Corynebacterium sanguinis]MCT1445177.1 30S ribosomal protein S17 [Corynebacterium sanguinis]